MSARRTLTECPTRPELLALIEKAKSHVMTPEERRLQRRSCVRGNMMLAHPEMTAEEVNAILDKIEAEG